MNPKPIVAELPVAELAKADAESSPTPIESPAAQGPWTRDIEALCRALAAQERPRVPRVNKEEK